MSLGSCSAAHVPGRGDRGGGESKWEGERAGEKRRRVLTSHQSPLAVSLFRRTETPAARSGGWSRRPHAAAGSTPTS